LSIKLFLLELLRFLLNKEEILDLLEEVEVAASHMALHLKEVAALEEAQGVILKVEVVDQVNHMVLPEAAAEVVAQGVIPKEAVQEAVREVIRKEAVQEAEARASLMALQGADKVVAAAAAMLSLVNLKKLVS